VSIFNSAQLMFGESVQERKVARIGFNRSIRPDLDRGVDVLNEEIDTPRRIFATVHCGCEFLSEVRAQKAELLRISAEHADGVWIELIVEDANQPYRFANGALLDDVLSAPSIVVIV
jgi:hypothetical protein